MVTRERFNTVKERYGHYASWAVWAAEGVRPKYGMGDISFFDDPSDELLVTLNPEIVLVALNISRPIPRARPFGNFHPDYSHAQDYRLRFALRGTRFWGGYLTDIIKDFEEKVSGKMRAYLRHHRDFEQENVDTFTKELDAIGAKSPTVVALGADSYAILTRNLGDQFRILKAPHYSMRINTEQYRLRFRNLATQVP